VEDSSPESRAPDPGSRIPGPEYNDPPMTILDQFLRDGDRLFRLRSYFPLLLVPVLVGGIWSSGAPFTSGAVERGWEIVAVIVALGGLALRVWAVGTAPEGTSERSTTNPRASQLRTSGLYSMLRHPLYVANGLMAFGIALFPGIWYLPLIVVLATTVYYERIAAREEQFLEGLFGETFREWAGRVPAVFPRLANRTTSTTPMSWRKAIRGEFHGLLVITASVCLLDVVEVSRRTGHVGADPVWWWVFVVSAVLFLLVRTVKKTTRLLESRP
jgi:protein-S-isoprenylcysteine O-methyltransferase Ste14